MFRPIKAFTLVAGLFLSLIAVGQTPASRTLSGTVVDASGAPLPGVVVSISGTSSATSTDLDGKYSIHVTGDKVLEFSCLGFVSKTLNSGIPPESYLFPTGEDKSSTDTVPG